MKNVKIDNDEAMVSINSDIFSLEVAQSAAYVLIDRAYFSFHGDPKDSFEVEIKAKEGEGIKTIVRDFQNELINYSTYIQESERNKEVRKAIIQRALGTNLKGDIESFKELDKFLSPKKREKE